MSLRHQAGINLPGYNALKVANAPTIGTATSASGTSVSVAFTAPSCVGGGAITSYTAFACCGVKTGTAASSPVTVTGLTTGQSYTFKVFATNAYGPSYPSSASNSVTPSVIGQDAYTTAGTYSWVAPAGVTSVSVVAVGGGGGGSYGGSNQGRAGGGGELRYKNNILVTPGNSYTVVVGDFGSGGPQGYPVCNPPQNQTDGGNSSFNSTTVVANGGKKGIWNSTQGAGGSGGIGDGGGNGGAGGTGQTGGGGGAGGYSGAGGAGGAIQANGSAGAGGGGGGGSGGQGTSNSSGPWRGAGGGGGVGILGVGCSGSGGVYSCGSSTGGFGGSGGSTGECRTTGKSGGNGASYGGGGGSGSRDLGTCFGRGGGSGGVGAVRIIWPGTTRSFPSTNTGNL